MTCCKEVTRKTVNYILACGSKFIFHIHPVIVYKCMSICTFLEYFWKMNWEDRMILPTFGEIWGIPKYGPYCWCLCLLSFFFFFFWLLKHSKIPSDLTYPEVLLQKIFIYALSCNMSFKMQNFMAIWQKIDLTTYLL